jgi:hypothetical protein
MRHILRVLIIIIGCSISHSVLAQKAKLYIEPNKTYSKGNIYIKKSLVPISAKGLTLVNDTVLQYTDKVTGLPKSLNVPSSSINYVKMRVGTKAGEFALYGAGLMLLSSLYGVLTAEKSSVDTYGDTSDINWLPFIAGFTAGGAAIGGLIGLCCPKYKNLYFKDRFTTYTFKITPFYSKNTGTGLGVRLTF